MRAAFVALIALGFAGFPAVAQEPIRFARTPDLSPDGKLVAFSYLGDIWTVEAIGGVARPVTAHEAHDYFPCFSPNGQWIAFSSNRHGSYDVFVVPVHGGKPKRLTFDSGHDVVNGWTPDGKSITFSSTRSTNFPYFPDVYTVPIDGGSERRIPLYEGKEAYFSPDGAHLAFVRGPGTWYRRGYRGSANDDVWVAHADGSSPRRITNFEGQDTSPAWSADGRKLYYVTDRLAKPGCANLVVQDLAADLTPSGSPRAVTNHADESVRRARISANGERVVYECGADLWVISTKGGSPRKLAIEVHADDKSNTERTVTFTRDATEFALSSDENHAVLVVHGELVLTKLIGTGKTTRLTDHPAFDHAPNWAPDGKKILFASDRSGVEDLYVLEADDPETPDLTKAARFKVTRLTDSPAEESSASFAPKGDRIAFLRSGQLWIMNPDGTNAKTLVAFPKVTSFDWSPDGTWIVFSRMDGSFASEVYIVPADGSDPPKNVTRYATYNGDVSWSEAGGKVAFLSQRRGTYSMHVLSLQRPGSTVGKPAEIDWDDIHRRVNRPSTMTAETGVVSPDGTLVAFRALSNGDDLWVSNTDGGSVGRVTSGDQSPRHIRWAKRAGGLIYFLNSKGELRATRASYGTFTGASGPSSEPLNVKFSAAISVRRDEEFAEMFAQSWRLIADGFYDPKFHGVDWSAVRTKYVELVPHVATREDLYALIHLMLGELNASHLGIGGRLPSADEATADLGLVFDETYRGPGLKIAEVLKGGPADKKGINLHPGEIVVAIDRTELTNAVNVSKLLNGTIGESVRLDVTVDPKDPKSRRKVEVVGVNRTKVSQIRYDRWVERNAEQVAKASNGKLGYVHIPSMDDDGLEAFVRSLYSDNFDKDGLVIDVRYNGGGFTHDAVLNYLSGKEHTIFKQRNGGEGGVFRNYDRKWAKPSLVLVNNRSVSDAEIFPQAFRTLGLGKVVGQPTGGQVIGTNEARLIDGSWFNLPRTGIYSVAGTNLEKQGVAPDILIEADPGDRLSTTDSQLAKALDVLRSDVASWQKAKAALAAAPIPGGPGGK